MGWRRNTFALPSYKACFASLFSSWLIKTAFKETISWKTGCFFDITSIRTLTWPPTFTVCMITYLILKNNLAQPYEWLLLNLYMEASAISNYSAMEVSRDFSAFLPSYSPSNPWDALVSLVKLNGLRLGKRDAPSCGNFNRWCCCYIYISISKYSCFLIYNYYWM